MKTLKLFALGVFVAFAPLITAQQSRMTYQHNLMPVPSSVQFLDGRLNVTSTFKSQLLALLTRGCSQPWVAFSSVFKVERG
jgi:hypothetical protein